MSSTVLEPEEARRPELREADRGSGARAYAVTGDVLEAEPYCSHVPARYRRLVEAGEAESVDIDFAQRDRPRRSLPNLREPA